MQKLFIGLKGSLYAGLLLLLAACGQQSLQPLDKEATIVAFGDSLTQGVGAAEGKNYPSVLAELSGVTVVNAGVSGETTSEGVLRLPIALQKYQPDLVILIEGGNDILQNLDQNQTKANLARMIQMIRLEGAQVVMLGIPEKNLFSDSADFYDELAEEYDLVYDAETMSELLKTRGYKSDSVHLNNAGYRELANRIYTFLQEQGAL